MQDIRIIYLIVAILALLSWREAVSRSHTSAQLAMALYVLESCVAWDKSIMKAVSRVLSSARARLLPTLT